jgi:hypothetical protein
MWTVSRRLFIHAAYRNLVQERVHLLLFLKSLFEKSCGFIHPELFSPGPKRAVTGNLVMFDSLCGSNQASIHDLAALDFGHNLLAFFDKASIASQVLPLTLLFISSKTR